MPLFELFIDIINCCLSTYKIPIMLQIEKCQSHKSAWLLDFLQIFVGNLLPFSHTSINRDYILSKIKIPLHAFTQYEQLY